MLKHLYIPIIAAAFNAFVGIFGAYNSVNTILDFTKYDPFCLFNHIFKQCISDKSFCLVIPF